MDEEGARNLLNQADQLWFSPEIERRRVAGTLPADFKLFAAQVIMDLDTEQPIVRFNDEVHGIMRAEAARSIQAGEEVKMSDLSQIYEFIITEEHPNAGHLTAILHGNRWRIFFDFRRNAVRIEKQLTSADQFLKTARFCVDSKLTIPAIDNLYDAVQIMAKCFLLIFPDRKVLEAKSHGFIEANFNFQGKLGLVPPISVELMNSLSRLRPKTRYVLDPPSIEPTQLLQLLENAETMRADLEKARPQRIKLK